MSDLIHVYYQNDQRLCVCFFYPTPPKEEVFWVSAEKLDDLEALLYKTARPNTPVCVFIDVQQAAITETTVPLTFTEDDIEQLIILDQAKFFPMLDQAIYFDFFITMIDKENKKINIIACNAHTFLSLEKLFRVLKLRWEVLGVSQSEWQKLNLLPWRQRKKNYLKRKQHKIFYIACITAASTLLVIYLWCMHLTHENETRKQKIEKHLQEQTTKLAALEAANSQYQQLQQVWQGYIDIAQQQESLKKILAIIESERLVGLSLEEVQWHEKKLFLIGYAPNIDTLKFYISRLGQSHLYASLQSINSLNDKIHRVQFEIVIEGLS